MTALTQTTLPTLKFFDPNGVELEMDAGDAGSGNEIAPTGKICVIAHNTDASAQTIGIASEPENQTGREGDISEELAADQYHVFLLNVNGWVDSGGDINITVTDAGIKIGWFYLP